MKFLLTLFLVLIASASTHASESLSYSGRLVNTDGSPVSGPVRLRFELAYSDASATILCHKEILSVPLTNGVFHSKLDFIPTDCMTPTATPLSTVLSGANPGETTVIRVVDVTNSKTYSFQAFHSVPFAMIADTAKTLAPLGASDTGKVLQWNGTIWTPATLGSGTGSVNNVSTGTGLTGGPITTTGTISIANGGVNTTQLADGAVTDIKIAGPISRSKIATGVASQVVVNDGSGNLSSVATIPIAQGGTGSSTAAGARTNLGLGGAAVANIGYASGNVMPGDGVPVCFSGFKLNFTGIGPTYWSCIAEDGSDSSKLPLAGGTMVGAIEMSGYKVTGLPTPVDPDDAANKDYVDNQITAGSLWDEASGNVYRSSGSVGIGTSTPTHSLDVNGTFMAQAGAIAAGDFGVKAVGASGAARDILLVGQNGYSNGFTVRYDGTRMNYSFLDGNLGIGLNNPQYKLVVAGPNDTSTQRGQINIGDSASDMNLNIGTGVGHTSDKASWIQSTESGVSNSRALLLQPYAGYVGIGGLWNPTAILHLAGGSATAGHAPLKFTAGTNLTTPEVGAVEFDGTNLYFTDNTNTRKTLATSVGATSIQPAAGNAGSPSYSFSTDTDTGFYSSGANQIGIAVGGSQIFSFGTNGLVSQIPGGSAISTSAGTSGAPTYSFAGDADTGWYSPAGDTLAAATAGNERIRINPNGTIGIGTATPENTASWDRVLEVAGSDHAKINVTSTAVNMAVNAHNSGFYSAPAGGMIGTKSSHPVSIYTNSTSRMTVSSDGRVGIGTTAPSGRLQVETDSTAHGLYVLNSRTTSDNYGVDGEAVGTGANLNVGGYFVATGATTNRALMIPGNFPVPGSNNHAIYSESTANSYFAGNVGIGTAAPVAPLSVGNANGAFISTHTDGASNYLAGAFGSGVLWDGANWVSRGDGGANGGALMAGQKAGALSFFIFPNTSGSDQATSDANLDNYRKFSLNYYGQAEFIGSMKSSVNIDPQTTDDSGITLYRTNGSGGYFPISLRNTVNGETSIGDFALRTGSVTSSKGAETWTTRMVMKTNGRFGFGVINPDALLHLGTNSGAAPLKFTSAAVLGTPQAGAVEYDGTNLYFTDSTNTRKTLSGASASGAMTGVSSISNAAGNIALTPNALTGAVSIGPGAVSTNSTSGTLVVTGDTGVSGVINAGGAVSSGSKFVAPGGSSTATTPTYSFSGDPDTGWYSPAPDKLAASTAGVERIRIEDNGQIRIGAYTVGVGSANSYSYEIGGANPTATNGQATIFLHHHSNLAHQLRYTAGTLHLEAAGNGYGSTNTPNFHVGGKIGIGTGASNYAITAKSGSDGTAEGIRIEASDHSTNGGYLIFNKNSGSGTAGIIQAGDNSFYDPIAINPLGGRVGIGTASPSQKLHVAGDILIDDGSGTGTLYMRDGTISKNVGTGFNFNSTVAAAAGGPGSPGHTFVTDQNSGMYLISPGVLALTASNNPAMKMTSTAVSVLNALEMGIDNPQNTGTFPGYGNMISFLGGPAGGTFSSNNSDPLWIARYNVASDQSELRLNVADNPQAEDAFVIGQSSPTFTPIARFQADGKIGLGVNPSNFLEISPNAPSPQGTVYVHTPFGSSFFTGHQQGAGYSSGAAIFNAVSDNSMGALNYFFRGTAGGSENALIRADGFAIFKSMLLDGIQFNEVGSGGADSNGSVVIEGKGPTRTPGSGAALVFRIPANTDGSNGWDQGRILTTPDNASNANADGRMYLQTRYNDGVNWKWRSNIVMHATGTVGIGTSSASEMLEVNGNAKAVAFLYTSDARLKKDIKLIENPIEKIMKLKGVEFRWKSNNEKTLGFIAQDVEKVVPELVRTDKKSSMKSVQYANIISIVVEAIKKMKTDFDAQFSSNNREVASLKQENKDLKNKVESLEKRLERLEQRSQQKP